jgi:hypothetical protein
VRKVFIEEKTKRDQIEAMERQRRLFEESSNSLKQEVLSAQEAIDHKIAQVCILAK